MWQMLWGHISEVHAKKSCTCTLPHPLPNGTSRLYLEQVFYFSTRLLRQPYLQIQFNRPSRVGVTETAPMLDTGLGDGARVLMVLVLAKLSKPALDARLLGRMVESFGALRTFSMNPTVHKTNSPSSSNPLTPSSDLSLIYTSILFRAFSQPARPTRIQPCSSTLPSPCRGHRVARSGPSSSFVHSRRVVASCRTKAEFTMSVLHQFSYKADIWRYSWSALSDIVVRRFQRPRIGVNKVGEDDGDTAGFTSFAMYIGRTIKQTRIVCRQSWLMQLLT